MAKVLVLPDHVASQIAAGEVVERPASVAKELIENAIDAGATSINISVSEGCRSIRVADNGCGMDADDAVLAFHRHATSKLRAADDLWRLSSLGFRGEALPSIASVAKVTCYTRRRESATGLRIEAMDGKLNAVETGCASGTVMEVVDLFYNVPARLNFLKKAATEFAHILEVAQNLAIAYPEISFELLKNNEKSLRTSGSGQLEQAIREVGFISIRDSLIAVSGSDFQHGLSVSGYIASPLHFRGDRKAILSIVNRRPVRCPLTYKALEYAYSDLIPRGRHPLAVLIVTLDAADLDVNIHPTKKEIKYSHGNEVYLTIQRAIMDALRQHGVAKTAFSATAVPEVESSFKSFSEDEYVRVSDRSLASDRSLGAASILVDTATPSFEASPKIVGEPSAVKPQQLGFKDRL
ncbi:MAG TPA: DNA mismatch repair endonuclease MutL, partial [Candidatus Obscuribacterales bacterium]